MGGFVSADRMGFYDLMRVNASADTEANIVSFTPARAFQYANTLERRESLAKTIANIMVLQNQILVLDSSIAYINEQILICEAEKNSLDDEIKACRDALDVSN